MKKQNLSIFIITTICSFNIFFTTSCFDLDMCGNDITDEIISPDGKLKAVVFERDCGATTSFSTQISILNYNESLPNKGGNLFYAVSKNGQAELTEKGVLRKLEVKWLNEAKLLIKYDIKAEVTIEKNTQQNIEAIYDVIQ